MLCDKTQRDVEPEDGGEGILRCPDCGETFVEATLEPIEAPNVITPRDWLHNALTAYGVRSVRELAEGRVNVRTPDDREFIVTIREIAQ